MKGDHVRDKCISACKHCVRRNALKQCDPLTPGCHHVEIEQSGKGAEECTSGLKRLDPEEEREHQEEDGNGLIVVRARDRSGNIARNDSNEGSSKETGTLILQLLGEPSVFRVNFRSKNTYLERRTCMWTRLLMH